MTSLLHALLLAAATDSCVTSTELRAPSRAGQLLAIEVSTALPRQPRPAVLLISGAGPHTREYSTDAGNVDSGNRAFAVLRNALIRVGYAVVRYDERGTGASTGNYDSSATTATLAEDVEDIIAALRQSPSVKPDSVVLIGHSEGAAIAWLVASRVPSVRAVVSLAGPAWSGNRVIEWQRRHLAASGSRGEAAQTIAARLASFDREHQERTHGDRWYQYFLTYDPLAPLARVRQPLLVLQGDADDRVAPEQAAELVAAAQAAGNQRVRRVMLAGHDHAFAPPGGAWYPGRFSEQVVAEVLGWLREELPVPAPRCSSPR